MAQKPKRPQTVMQPLLTPQQRAEIARRKQNEPQMQRTIYELPDNHGWRVSPGHQLVALGRGDLLLEYPAGWVPVPQETSLKLHDRPYPDDTMQFEVSVMKLPPLDMKRLPPGVNPLEQICKVINKDGIFRTPEDAEIWDGPGLHAEWIEYEKPDRDNGRPTSWRHCFCYPTGRILPYSLIGLVTFGYYSELWEAARAVWEHSLHTLVMGEQIADPKRGPRRS